MGTVIGVLALGGLAAYSLAKLNAPGSGLVTLYLLVGSSLPIELFLVPLFFVWLRLGLVNNLFGLVLIYIAVNAPFAIFLAIVHGAAPERFRGCRARRRRQ